MPGIMPIEASSRNAMRDILNLRYTARGRPVSVQRLRTRIGDPSRGISASFRRAAKRSSAGTDSSRATALSRARFAAYRFTSLIRPWFFSTALFFAISL